MSNPKSKSTRRNPMYRYKVYVTETITRPIWITADTPVEAERIAEESYEENEVMAVSFEADPMSRQPIEMNE